MVATWNPSADSGYYTTTNYYVGSATARSSWFAPSQGFDLANGASIDHATFSRLFAGLASDGSSIVSQARKRDRVPAFDITLSAPRSVSLVWALAAPDLKRQVEEAQRRAVVATLAMLDDEATFARRGKGGATLEKVRATVAMFLHGDSRPARHNDGSYFADPNLHTHNVILNMARRADGSSGAIHSSILRDHKMAAGAYYHAALASELQALGFGIDRVGKNGIFEIAGVSGPVIDFFSARRNEIKDELQALNTTSAMNPATASSVAKSTRGAKARPEGVAREGAWTAAAERLQIRADSFSESFRDKSIALNSGSTEEAFATRLAEALVNLTANDSVVRRQDVIGSIAAAMVGTGLPLERVSAEVDRLITDGEIVHVGFDSIGLLLYSTPDVIAIERRVEETASRLIKRRSFALDPRAVKQRCERDRLSAEQSDAVLSMTSRGGIAVVEGSAGAGKTTLLKSVVASYKEDKYRVLGAAMAWQAANVLNQDLDIDAWSTASLVNQLENGNVSLDARTIVVIDEAGLIGSREMAVLLQEVEHAGAKAILIGDRRQLQPIGAGPALGIVAGVVETTRVDTIVRQNQQWARNAVADLRDGLAIKALEAFREHGQVVEAEGARAAIVAAVNAWEEPATGETKLLIAKTNLQVAALSREVRVRLRDTGGICGEDIVIPSATPSGHAVDVALAIGDRIRFLARNDTLKVVNGTNAVVTGIKVQLTPEVLTGRQISIEATIGNRKVVFHPEEVADDRGRALLGYAYATTVYGSQGLTVDHATVLVDGTFNRHEAYVAASRARRETKLVIDSNAVDLQLRRQPLRARAPSLVTSADRLSWLASRLARESRKLSTVEVIAAEKARRVGRRPTGRLKTAVARSTSKQEEGLEI